jgi:hypothetical protein
LIALSAGTQEVAANVQFEEAQDEGSRRLIVSPRHFMICTMRLRKGVRLKIWKNEGAKIDEQEVIRRA